MDSNSFHGITRQKIALLIDFDNVILGIEDPGFDVEIVVNALRERGLIVLGRAYGDWYRHNRHRRRLMEQGIDLIETPVFGPIIKNSADMHMALDAFEIAHTQPHIDTFCIVSGDSDFLPLIKRLQSRDKMVIVIAGHRFTSELVRRNCNEYLAYENLLAESVGAEEDVTTIEGAYQLLHRTIDTLQERDIEVRSSTVKQMMVQLNPAFSERNFGCHQFKQFLDRAARAQIVTLNPRHGMAGESIVLLGGDTATEIRNVEAPPREPRETSARDNRGTDNRNANRNGEDRNKRTRRSDDRKDEKPTREATPAVEAKEANTDAPAENETAKSEWSDPNSMLGRVPLRRGRLRYSAREGRTLINQPTGPQAEAETKTEAAPVEEIKAETANAESVTPEISIESGAETASESALVEAEASDDAEQKPTRKRSTRGGRKRKAAETAAAETAAAEAPTDETSAVETTGIETNAESVAATPTPEAAAPEVASAESEPPKKKTRSRRKTAATKKAEAAAETTATATAEETAAKDASDLNAVESVEVASVDNSATEDAPKPKRRRRSPAKKKVVDDAANEA